MGILNIVKDRARKAASSLQRYDWEYGYGNEVSMIPDDMGDYVLLSNVENLIEKMEILEMELRQ